MHKTPHSNDDDCQRIGTPCKLNLYPSKSVLHDHDYGKCESRLVTIFGKPYRHKLLSKFSQNVWTKNFTLSHSRIEWISHCHLDKIVMNACINRGFAINQQNGWIAMMNMNNIWVFRPFGGYSYRLKAFYFFKHKQKLKGSDIQNSRIRFINDRIFVYIHTKQCIYSYKLSYKTNKIKLIDVIYDKYFKEIETMDITVINDLLIILFDRWCGIYKLHDSHPKLEWYHAVAFATESVNCFSLEMNGHYMFINTQHQIIGIHPTNPTFEHLHVAQNTKHGKSKFCLSNHYGLFYISNDGKIIYQSPNLEHDSVQKVFKIGKHNNYPCKQSKHFYPIEKYHDLLLRDGINKICNICYDEGYGISGRLLIYCQTKKPRAQYFIHQMFNHNELLPLYHELIKMNHHCVATSGSIKQFNLIISVYEMLYGEDLIQILMQSQSFNTNAIIAFKPLKKQTISGRTECHFKDELHQIDNMIQLFEGSINDIDRSIKYCIETNQRIYFHPQILSKHFIETRYKCLSMLESMLSSFDIETQNTFKAILSKNTKLTHILYHFGYYSTFFANITPSISGRSIQILEVIGFNDCTPNNDYWAELDHNALISKHFREAIVPRPMNDANNYNKVYCVIAICTSNCLDERIYPIASLLELCIDDKEYLIGFRLLKCLYKICKGYLDNIFKAEIKINKRYFGNKISKMKCSNCKKILVTYKSCSGCMQTMYCNKRCQKIHWKNQHSKICDKSWNSMYCLLKQCIFDRVRTNK